MNNLYHKVTVASVCTALSFTLGANKEAKAATFTLTATRFVIEGNRFSGVGERLFDSEGSPSSGNISVQAIGDSSGRTSTTERRAFYEFDIRNLPLAPNTTISRASFEVGLGNIDRFFQYLFLGIYGYEGDGIPNLSDFDAGGVLPLREENAFTPAPLLEPRQSISFDVTQFVKGQVSNRHDFAGFGIRIQNFSLNHGKATLNNNASLKIETAEAVPEPATIFGSALALGVGGWLKRKKSNQQNKTAPQR